MAWAIGKILLSAVVISFTSWLANKKPALAGFIVALPLSTLLVLFLNHSQFHDTAKSVQFARSIFFAIPLSLTFFLPFLFAERLKLGFWGLYLTGITLLIAAYFVHKNIFQKFL